MLNSGNKSTHFFTDSRISLFDVLSNIRLFVVKQIEMINLMGFVGQTYIWFVFLLVQGVLLEVESLKLKVDIQSLKAMPDVSLRQRASLRTRLYS